MARDPHLSEPIHNTGGQDGFPNSLILFKGKLYLWLANPPMARDQPTDPQPRVRVPNPF